MTTETGPPRLDQAMNRRRLELNELTWKQVAERAGLTEFTLQRIRGGKTKLTDRAAAKIDRALEWELGSAWLIYHDGIEPTPLRREHAPPIPDGVSVDPADWAIMTDEERRLYVRIVTGVRRRREQQRGA